MDTFEEVVKLFSRKFRTKGTVEKVTSYSFSFVTYPDKNGKTKETVYMKSYFYNSAEDSYRLEA